MCGDTRLAAAIVAVLVMIPVAGNAACLCAPTITGDPVTFVQASDGCTGGCGIDPNNTVKIWTTNVADVYQITVSLDTGWTFMKDPNGNGHDATFAFSDKSSSLIINNINSNGGSSFTTTSNPTHMAPLTFPATAYGLSNSVQKSGTLLTFDVRTSDSTLALFLASLQSATGESDSPFFAADVSSTTGKTGVIDFAVATTPLPAALPLFAGGLAVVGLLSRRRKRKAQSAAAAAQAA
jgi:hypothetical protein